MVNKNVLSGLLLFSISVMIGPWMMGVFASDQLGPAGQALFGEARELQGALAAHEGAADEGAKAAAADNVAVAAGKTTVEQLKYGQVESRWGNFKFSHAHGNLQGILNIVVGLVLAQLLIAVKFREVISWLFIVGSWGHAGFFIAGNFLITTNRDLGFFFLSNAKFGGGLLILGILALLVAVIMHMRSQKMAG